ncbi:retrovirus-related pol polyprotein from transposon TNT 1-94 [Tanacetum coccineum]
MVISIPPKFEANISAIEESCDLNTLTVFELTSKLQAQEQRVSIRSEEKVEDDSMKWHKRFGHFNYITLQHMYTTKLVRDMPPISEVDSKCEGCELGKSHRLPFLKSGVMRATHKLEIMHSDICGPMSTPSWSVSRVKEQERN